MRLTDEQREEAKALFRRIAEGREEIRVVGETWDDTYAGNVEFVCGKWSFAVFNDCDCFDYIDIVRYGGREDEYPHTHDLLEHGLEEGFERALKDAKR